MKRKRDERKPAPRDDQKLVQTWIPKSDWELLKELAIASRDMKISAYVRRLIDKELKRARSQDG